MKRQKGTSSDIAAILLTLAKHVSIVSQTRRQVELARGEAASRGQGQPESEGPCRFFLQISSLTFREQSPKRISSASNFSLR